MQRDMQKGLVERGLTQVRANLIWELGARQPMTQRDLAEVLGVTPRNVTALLDALEKGNFVQRADHPTDRRAILVSLSPAGQAARERLQSDLVELADTLFSGVSSDDLDAFSRVAGAASEKLKSLDAR